MCTAWRPSRNFLYASLRASYRPYWETCWFPGLDEVVWLRLKGRSIYTQAVSPPTAGCSSILRREYDGAC